uniref:Uncharacterized protein n=1 Tax=Clytia hemisphaerica TaxID=252671 RepID=A0A7M5XEX2_9CNID
FILFQRAHSEMHTTAVLVFIGCTLITGTSCLTNIPAYCHKPHGQTCAWYPECIEKRQICPGNDNYAMKYAHHFCTKFGQEYSTFGTTGQKWVDATRLCLQRALVPYLDDQSVTCKNLKKVAFDSHVCCYLGGPACTPSNEIRPSVCDVPIKDWLRLFWIVKGSFNIFGQHAEVVGSLRQIMGVLKGCAKHHVGR